MTMVFVAWALLARQRRSFILLGVNLTSIYACQCKFSRLEALSLIYSINASKP